MQLLQKSGGQKSKKYAIAELDQLKFMLMEKEIELAKRKAGAEALIDATKDDK